MKVELTENMALTFGPLETADCDSDFHLTFKAADRWQVKTAPEVINAHISTGNTHIQLTEPATFWLQLAKELTEFAKAVQAATTKRT